MKTFRDIVNEKTENKVIFVAGELWLTYGQSSGSTSQFPDIKKWISNDSKESHYDSMTDRLVKWAKDNKPLKSNKSKTDLLFEIPVYPTVQMGQKYDIWGGDVKSIKNYYMTIHTPDTAVVNLFDNKNEALAWIKSIA